MAKAKAAKKATKVVAKKSPSHQDRLKAHEEKVYQSTLAKVLNFLDKHELAKEKAVTKAIAKLERDAAKKFAALLEDKPAKKRKKRKAKKAVLMPAPIL